MCDMDLWKFPLDKQTCDVRILSCESCKPSEIITCSEKRSNIKHVPDAYPDSQMQLEWSARIKPIDVNQAIKMPDMKLENYTHDICDGQYATGKLSSFY